MSNSCPDLESALAQSGFDPRLQGSSLHHSVPYPNEPPSSPQPFQLLLQLI
uniref:Uncharacterized protein n=1 Tax=Anguilla anguilla TaxID=7936 RepID=A0A0E9XPZ2_ANGAN